AFMEGNQQSYQAARQLMLNANPPLSSDILLQTAEDMVLVGDLNTGQTLIDKVRAGDKNNPRADALSQKIAVSRQTADSKFRELKGLSRRVTKSYWDETAGKVLSVAGGDWRVHAFVADQLEDKHDYGAALLQQKLTARFAPSVAERDKWLKKAEKT